MMSVSVHQVVDVIRRRAVARKVEPQPLQHKTSTTTTLVTVAICLIRK